MSKHAGIDLLFYQRDKVITVAAGKTVTTIFGTADVPCAQRSGQSSNSGLLAIDAMSSVLKGPSHSTLSYTPYGYTPEKALSHNLIGFNGELTIRQLAGYLLGNGYRTYRPGLMRMNSPDNLSPFAEGGLNAYMYCLGDPVNNTDPSGHLTRPRWRAPTTATLQNLRARELAVNRQEVRALENELINVARQQLRHTQQSHPAAIGNLNLRIPSTRAPLDLDTTYRQPTPQLQIPGQQQPQQPAPTPTRSDSSHAPFARHFSSDSSASRTRERSPSPLLSDDSWDEWRPNPEDAMRRENEGIARAIRQARH